MLRKPCQDAILLRAVQQVNSAACALGWKPEPEAEALNDLHELLDDPKRHKARLAA